jgi:conjugative transfer signal peptidase TraF
MKWSMLLACMGLGLAALCAPTTLHVPVQLVYNPSDSVSRGWYRVGRIENANSLHVGNIVLARLPVDVALLAAQRGYLPSGVPILKRIGAVAPQSVCVREQVVRIDGAAMVIARTHDGEHRPLPVWSQCRLLVGNELFLLGDANPASFDSRYFGPIAVSDVLGVARPLWTWSSP